MIGLKLNSSTKLLKHFLPEDKSTRLSSDMIKLFTELIFVNLFIKHLHSNNSTGVIKKEQIQIDIQHLEKILMQLLLDF